MQCKTQFLDLGTALSLSLSFSSTNTLLCVCKNEGGKEKGEGCFVTKYGNIKSCHLFGDLLDERILGLKKEKRGMRGLGT